MKYPGQGNSFGGNRPMIVASGLNAQNNRPLLPFGAIAGT
jgi:hypothetical protein